jgi:hypothetical protein
VNLRPFDAAAGDADRLGQFRCSTGAPFEDEAETWIRNDAVGWVNDLPRAQFQRRTLAFIEDGETTVAVVAWQDIVRVDLEGIWLEVLAVALDHQHSGHGQAAYELTIDHLRTIERDGGHLAGHVHVDNDRSKRLLTAYGWSSVAPWDDHELWVGSL